MAEKREEGAKNSPPPCRARVQVKRNQQTPKESKSHALQNGYLTFSFFDPENQNFDFSKLNTHKIKYFEGTQNNRNKYYRTMCQQQVYKISG